MAGSFQLNSTQTAIAIIPPEVLTESIQKLRSTYDKAYLKWPPHFNILYPSISSAQLSIALETLRKRLAEEPLPNETLSLSIEEVGSFNHRKNATVFLKLGEAGEQKVKSLRSYLCAALGREEDEGTVDGEFKPHLTIGQAVLQGKALEKLTEQANACINGSQWPCTELAVLKRNTSGNMEVVDTISLIQKQGLVSNKAPTTQERKSNGPPGWESCFFAKRRTDSETETSPKSDAGNKNGALMVATLNIMADDWAPAFEDRLPLIENEVDELFEMSGTAEKVLCLQEVDQDMLPMLLKSSTIRDHLPYSSHSPSAQLPSIRNKIILSSLPFRQFNLPFPEKHKSALFANFPDLDVTVVNVHLTSALTDQSVPKKKRQMDMITEFLMQNKMLKTSIVAGDFNTTTSTSTIQNAISKHVITRETADLVRQVINPTRWKDAYIAVGKTLDASDEELFEGEEGATFDRINNPLAGAKPAPIDDRPQRYDRILVHNDSRFEIGDFGYFAKPDSDDEESQISDHYGVYAKIYTSDPLKTESALQSRNAKEVELEKIEVLVDNFDFKSLLDSFMPSPTDRNKRDEALVTLRSALHAYGSLENVIVEPLGSYAMDTDFADSDIDVLVIGSIDSAAFFKTAQKALIRFWSGPSHVPYSILVNSLVQILETTVDGVKVDIQYCQSTELIQKHAEEPNVPFSDLIFRNSVLSTLKPNSLRPLNTLRDTIYLRDTIPQLANFRLAHRFLSLCLRRHGLYSAKFGYLGGIHLTLLLNRVMKLIEAQNLAESKFTPATIVRTFFNYYSSFQWSRNVVEDPIFHLNETQYFRAAGGREPVVIRALHQPTARQNVSESCTQLSARTITAKFRAAAKKLLLASTSSASRDAAWKWCIRSKDASISDFLNLDLDLTAQRNQPGCFVRIRVETWEVNEQSANDVRHLIGSIESKIPGLLVGLGKAGGSNEQLTARAWPGRFWIPETLSAETDSITLLGYYLVGVTLRPEEDHDASDASEQLSEEEDSKGKKPIAVGNILPDNRLGKISSAAHDYAHTVQNLRAMKSSKAWVVVDVVERKKIWDMGLALDTRDWVYYSGTYDTDRVSARLAGESTDWQTAAPEPTAASAVEPSSSSLPSRPAKSSTSAQAPSSGSKKFLRPVQDILSRLRWDAAYDVEEYLIGYEDRFAGVKEMPLASWKSEATDEEFIPMHRIVWIRKRGDEGEKVWDRRMRFDALFGSGSGTPAV